MNELSNYTPEPSIHVIDAVMGSGKTCAMINFVNNSDKARRFLFVVPYISELARIQNDCAERKFFTPDADGGKLNNIKTLIDSHRNIVCTHKLFEMFDEELFDLLSENKYTLIMDETAQVVGKVDISEFDTDILTQTIVDIDDDNIVHWSKDDYYGCLSQYKNVIDKYDVYAYSNMVWFYVLPPELYSLFDEVFVMTYLFDGSYQSKYFKKFGIDYDNYYIAGSSPEDYRITKEKPTPTPIDYAELIEVYIGKMNKIGDGYFDLSKAWYRRGIKGRKEGGRDIDKLKNNVTNFFRRKVSKKSSDCLWTCFSGEEDHNKNGTLKSDGVRASMSGKGYTKAFLACNAKGTNEWRERTAIAYCVNRFPDAALNNYLNKFGITVNQDLWSLQEMLQFLFRSAIRDGKKVEVYVPSRRMRELLLHWMKEMREYGEMRDLPVVGRL